MTSIYHYTSGDSLLGIIKSKNLWATDIRFLNDFEELNKGLKLFEEFSKSFTEGILEQDDSYDSVCKLIKVLISNIRRNAELTSINVVSLTTKHDNLRQWMSYCKSETGYCIEFDSNILIPNYLKEHNNTIKINEIEYVEGYSDIKYQNSLNAMKDNLMEMLSDSNSSNNKALDIEKFTLKANTFLLNSIFLASSIKPMEFQDESEHRLIYLGQNKENSTNPPLNKEMINLYSKPQLPEPNYRTVGDVIIPYQPIPFNINAIKSVVIGPTSNTNLAKFGLTEFRDRNNLCFDIYHSKCSLRRF
jgi:hypothetical protein